jgi:uncharacterized protein YqeY
MRGLGVRVPLLAQNINLKFIIMTLQEQIRDDMIQAMKSKNIEVRDILRVAVGDFPRLNKEFGKELPDAVIIKKIIRPMVENAKEFGNDSEAKILEVYLPTMFGEGRIKLIVANIINEHNYSGMQDMGKVMGEIKKLPIASKIDGKISSSIVKQLLGQ